MVWLHYYSLVEVIVIVEVGVAIPEVVIVVVVVVSAIVVVVDEVVVVVVVLRVPENKKYNSKNSINLYRKSSVEWPVLIIQCFIAWLFLIKYEMTKYGFCKKSLWQNAILSIVEHFHLLKKVPVVINHNIQFFKNVMIH